MEIRLSLRFEAWLDALKDRHAAKRIVRRLANAQLGNLGDVKYFGRIGEMRIDYGPGYRLYFVRRGSHLLVLLCGGDKSTQQRDIEVATAMAKDY